MTTNATHTQGQPEWVTTRDGRQLYAQVLPGPESPTTPTVIFEAGAGAARWSWGTVQPPVSRHARAIVYDRSGMGKSAPDPVRTLARMVDDLCDVIDHYCGANGTVVLVGHSAGGPMIRLAASLRPKQVAALVLVDPTDEGVDEMFTPGFARLQTVSLYAALGLAYLGLARLLAGYGFKDMLKDTPADVRADFEREAGDAKTVHSLLASGSFLQEVRALKDRPPVIHGETPVTIISGGQTSLGMGESTRKAVNDAHKDQAARYPQGRHVVAEKSGHLVPLTEPQLVVDEIVRLL